MQGPSLDNRNLEILTQTRQSAQKQDSKRASQISSTSTNAEAQGRRRKTHIGPWELGADVGKGGCGKVRKVRHRVTGQQAAAKIISKRIAETARAESLASLVESSRRPNAGALALGANIIPFGIEREVVIMKLLKHPNIVQLFDVWENRNEL
jgi:serine/threonine-protein kinase HSL1 (negative regulator of Swe1 kinase)